MNVMRPPFLVPPREAGHWDKQDKEPGRHAKIPIRRQNRNEIIFTKEILYIYKIWVDPRDSHDQ